MTDFHVQRYIPFVDALPFGNLDTNVNKMIAVTWKENIFSDSRTAGKQGLPTTKQHELEKCCSRTRHRYFKVKK